MQIFPKGSRMIESSDASEESEKLIYKKLTKYY